MSLEGRNGFRLIKVKIVKRYLWLVMMVLHMGCASKPLSSPIPNSKEGDSNRIIFSIDSLETGCRELNFSYSVQNQTLGRILFASLKSPDDIYILSSGKVLGHQPGKICLGLKGSDTCTIKDIGFTGATGYMRIMPGKSLHSRVHVKLREQLAGDYFLRVEYDSREVKPKYPVWRGQLSVSIDSVHFQPCW